MAIAEYIITEPQAIFDHVVNHLREQGTKARSAGLICKYRGDDNTACAFGCLMPEGFYKPEWEGLIVRTLVGKEAYPELDAWNDPYTKALLAMLQDAHDMSALNPTTQRWDLSAPDHEHIRCKLNHIALMFSLKDDAVYSQSWSN